MNDSAEVTYLTPEQLLRAPRLATHLRAGHFTTGFGSLDASIIEMLESDDDADVKGALELASADRIKVTELGKAHFARARRAVEVQTMEEMMEADTVDSIPSPAPTLVETETSPAALKQLKPIETWESKHGVDLEAEPVTAEVDPDRVDRIDQIKELLATLRGGNIKDIMDGLPAPDRPRLWAFHKSVDNLDAIHDGALDRLFGTLVDLKVKDEQNAEKRKESAVSSSKALPSRRKLLTMINRFIYINQRDYYQWWSRNLTEDQLEILKKRKTADVEQLVELYGLMKEKISELNASIEAHRKEKSSSDEAGEVDTESNDSVPAPQQSEPAPLVHLPEDEQRRLLGNTANSQPSHPTRVSDRHRGTEKKEGGKKRKPTGVKKGKKG